MLGDVVGRSGREALQKYIPLLKAQWNPDVIVVNGENAAHGFGITPTIALDFFRLGVDCITSGNHIFDRDEIIPFLEQKQAILRPLNYPEGTPGKGWALIHKPKGDVLVLNALGRLYMASSDDPFRSVDHILQRYRLGQSVRAILLDFHAEATSEKMAMAFYCDSRVSAVMGTHTHMPTADGQILPGGTAYQTDLGMCGDYRSVVGMESGTAIRRFLGKVPSGRLTPAQGPGLVSGILIHLHPSGLTRSIHSICMGDGLVRSSHALET
jgi:metallophosphoesterase (TIGR00282 family)